MGGRAALAAFALLSLAMRVLAPSGYMLTADESRFITVTLCAAHDGAQARLNLETGQIETGSPSQDDPAKAQHDAPCAFAAAAPLASPESAALLNAPATLFVPAAGPAEMVQPGRGLAAPPPWATGPPLTV